MDKIELQKEYQYLTEVILEIEKQIKTKEQQINDMEEEMGELTHHFSEEYYNMDDEEAVSGGDELDDYERFLLASKHELIKLKKQLLSPYFGKIEFKANDEEDDNPYYIGIHNLTDGSPIPVVCDWRAPISSLYYDYEIGKGKYQAPQGEIEGDILSKRQFKITNSRMEYCFDSSLTVSDNVLAKELSKNASDKMKNIVATIQKEQNEIIRNSQNKNMLIQGVAGSGKTSIALHKIAYILYNQKHLKSKDIMIISPNDIFSEYISTVLPELGEENVLQNSFLKIAKQELGTLVPQIQNREQMIDELVHDDERLKQVAYKNSFEFFESLKIYLDSVSKMNFVARDLKFGDVKISATVLQDLYDRNYKDKKPSVRIDWIADYIVDQLNMGEKGNLVFDRVKKLLLPMFECGDIVALYSDFLNRIGMNFCLHDKKLGWEDVASLLYIKDYLIGTKEQKNIKYLVIDEMQDYSPVHFEIFKQMYKCPMLALGDMYQCIEKQMTNEDLENIASIINADQVLKLNKTYRSTYEITEFADKLKNKQSDKVDRHGEVPEILKCENKFEEAEKITQIIKQCQSKKYNSIAVLCKDMSEAIEYYSLLGEFEEIALIGPNDPLKNLMVMPASVSKGLEFDVVIIPNSSKQNYKSFIEKNLLYVSCTRALHMLYLTQVGE